MTLQEFAQLGPVATTVVAFVAFVIGLATLIQRSGADRRDQWWKRAQWALDVGLDDSDAGVVDFELIEESEVDDDG